MFSPVKEGQGIKKLQILQRLAALLAEEIGWTWPVFLIRCLFARNTNFRKTHWSKPAAPAEEARYVKNLILIPTVYLQLLPRVGQVKASQVVEKTLEATGDALYSEALQHILTRCVPLELFTELGIPELTRIIGKGDEKFFRNAFADLEFSRGDSWENTMAYGKNHCEYMLAVKPAA